MGKAAQKKAQNRYAWPAVARQIETVYAGLIASQRKT